MRVRCDLMAAILVGALGAVAGCGGSKSDAPGASAAPATAAAGSAAPGSPAPATTADEAPLPPSEIETKLPPGLSEAVLRTFTGDLPGMVERRLVRVGVTFNRTFYFVDKGVQRGVSYEYAQLVEQRLNEQLKIQIKNKVYVVVVPLPRKMLLRALVEGKVDIVAAQVTVRPDLASVVDFTDPTRKDVSQIIVSGPSETSPMNSVEALSGQEVFVRDGSSYQQSLVALNERFKAQGKPPVVIRVAPDNLEDDDLLEMVNAGLLPAIVVDDYLAGFWKKVFTGLRVHDDVVVHSGGNLAVGVRKSSPKLRAALNGFGKKYGLGTAFGNVVERKYLVNTTYAKSAASEAERRKFLTLVQFFRKYSDIYKLDYLLMAAQGYQESQLNQDARSQVGAIGVMQLMPATGKEQNVGDITKTEANIHAGVKYMRATEDAFFKDEPMDDLNKGLMTFASYNAGPGRIRQLRRETLRRGLDPNVWFGNVETIVAERVGRETVTYVSNIYKYYVAYKLVVEDAQRKADAKASVKADAKQ